MNANLLFPIDEGSELDGSVVADCELDDDHLYSMTNSNCDDDSELDGSVVADCELDDDHLYSMTNSNCDDDSELDCSVVADHLYSIINSNCDNDSGLDGSVVADCEPDYDHLCWVTSSNCDNDSGLDGSVVADCGVSVATTSCGGFESGLNNLDGDTYDCYDCADVKISDYEQHYAELDHSAFDAKCKSGVVVGVYDSVNYAVVDWMSTTAIRDAKKTMSVIRNQRFYDVSTTDIVDFMDCCYDKSNLLHKHDLPENRNPNFLKKTSKKFLNKIKSFANCLPRLAGDSNVCDVSHFGYVNLTNDFYHSNESQSTCNPYTNTNMCIYCSSEAPDVTKDTECTAISCGNESDNMDSTLYKIDVASKLSESDVVLLDDKCDFMDHKCDLRFRK